MAHRSVTQCLTRCVFPVHDYLHYSICEIGDQGALPLEGVEGDNDSELDLLSLTSLAVAGCG